MKEKYAEDLQKGDTVYIVTSNLMPCTDTVVDIETPRLLPYCRLIQTKNHSLFLGSKCGNIAYSDYSSIKEERNNGCKLFTDKSVARQWASEQLGKLIADISDNEKCIEIEKEKTRIYEQFIAVLDR